MGGASGPRASAVTEWSDQRDKAPADFSRPFAETAKREFRATKAAQLKLVGAEQRTQRQAMDAMRRKYESLRAVYLRITGTTYQAWTDLGPQAEWLECVEAVKDPSVWDRLVERGVVELEAGKADPAPRRRGGKR